MMRFIDLGKQIAVDESDPEWPRQFAFFNTIDNQFLKFDGEVVWDSWYEFTLAFDEEGIDDQDAKRLFERLSSLCPPWVFGSSNNATRTHV